MKHAVTSRTLINLTFVRKMGVIALGSSSSVMISTLIMLTSDLVVKLVEILRLLGFAYEQI